MLAGQDHRADIGAQAATRAAVDIHVTWLLFNGDVKIPGLPLTPITSLPVNNVEVGFARHIGHLRVRMQEEQSRVGKVLSSWAMRPPMLDDRSIR
jgi:hypothetical protein